MEHNLKATVETPEKGVFKHIITDGEETLDIVTSDSAIHSFVLAYRPDHEMPLKPIPCNTP